MDKMLKQRLVVMNGRSILQELGDDNRWHDENVVKAGLVPPGLYPLWEAQAPSEGETLVGVEMHVDHGHVYQKVGAKVIRHSLDSIDQPPKAGELINVWT